MYVNQVRDQVLINPMVMTDPGCTTGMLGQQAGAVQMMHQHQLIDESNASLQSLDSQQLSYMCSSNEGSTDDLMQRAIDPSVDVHHSHPTFTVGGSPIVTDNTNPPLSSVEAGAERHRKISESQKHVQIVENEEHHHHHHHHHHHKGQNVKRSQSLKTNKDAKGASAQNGKRHATAHGFPVVDSTDSAQQPSATFAQNVAAVSPAGIQAQQQQQQQLQQQQLQQMQAQQLHQQPSSIAQATAQQATFQYIGQAVQHTAQPAAQQYSLAALKEQLQALNHPILPAPTQAQHLMHQAHSIAAPLSQTGSPMQTPLVSGLQQSPLSNIQVQGLCNLQSANVAQMQTPVLGGLQLPGNLQATMGVSTLQAASNIAGLQSVQGTLASLQTAGTLQQQQTSNVQFQNQYIGYLSSSAFQTPQSVAPSASGMMNQPLTYMSEQIQQRQQVAGAAMIVPGIGAQGMAGAQVSSIYQQNMAAGQLPASFQPQTTMAPHIPSNQPGLQ
jgi:hypothetical protein